MIATGAEALVKSLEREGVQVIFGIPGGAILPVYDELYDSKIRHILARHEQCCAHMADGYARASRRVGVRMATSGPGATNLVTGITTAYMDSSPVVAITGQVPTPIIGKDGFQEADTIGITTPITKHNLQIRSVEEIPQAIKAAFYIASTGRPGPVLVDFPRDLQIVKAEVNYDVMVEFPGYRPRLDPHPSKLEESLGCLLKPRGR